MNAMHKKFLLLLVFGLILIPACGTFDIQVEQIQPKDTPEDASTLTTASPQPADPTNSPIVDDEILIRELLSLKLGVPTGELQVVITRNDGRHAYGQVSNGYFLAAKNGGGSWVIVYDGQATPACVDIEEYQFPVEWVPECLDQDGSLVVRVSDRDLQGNELVSLDCMEISQDSAEWVACNSQDALRSRNTSALLSFMTDPFTMAYWRSESTSTTPEAMLELLPDLYNYNDPDYTPMLSFTTDPSQFPSLDGQPPESLLDPEMDIILVVFSQGWEVDGNGEALIYITKDLSGDYHWSTMVYAAEGFNP